MKKLIVILSLFYGINSFGQTDPYIFAGISQEDNSCVIVPEFSEIEFIQKDKQVIIQPIWYGVSKEEIFIKHLYVKVGNTKDGGIPTITLTFIDGSKMELKAKSEMNNGKSYYLLTEAQELNISTIEVFAIQYDNTYDSIGGTFKNTKYFIDLFRLVNSKDYKFELY